MSGQENAKDVRKSATGVHAVKEAAKIEEQFRDEDMKIKCLEIVMSHGRDNDKSFPWNTAQKYYLWIKYGNPDMKVL